MNFEAVSQYLLDQFKKQEVRCAVIGGFALHAAGFSRATKDIDFLVHGDDVSKVKSILTGFGYDLIHESPDVMNFWGKLKDLGGVDFLIAHRKYALAMLQRVKQYEIFSQRQVNVIIPEDIIGLKLQSVENDPSRTQDLADIEWLVRRYGKSLNLNLIWEYFELFNRLDDFERLLSNAE